MMIKGLVLTDNRKRWEENFINALSFSMVQRTREETCITNSLFCISIRTNFKENCRGNRYHFCVLDKYFPPELIHTNILPTVKTLYTNNYWEDFPLEKEEE